jgi:hypothetical protein
LITSQQQTADNTDSLIADTDWSSDCGWFDTNRRRRYRLRPSAGEWMIVRRRAGYFLRTRIAALPRGVTDTDDFLRAAWVANVWPGLSPEARGALVKEIRKLERDGGAQ